MLILLALASFAFSGAWTQETASAAPVSQREAKPPQDVAAELRQRGVEIEFTGNENFSTPQLLGLFAREDERAISYLTDGVNNPEKLDIGLRLINHCLATQGYLRAKAGRPTIEATEHGHRLVVPIVEGARYRIGKFEIEGARYFSPVQIREMINLRAGDVANAAALYEAFAVRLHKAYADEGYIQFVADPEPTFHLVPAGEREGVVDFAVTIDEGTRFFVHSVEFVGNTVTPDWALRPALLLQEGQPFSAAVLNDSLKNLRDMKLFEPIDQDRDVDYRITEQGSQVKLIIRLKEKKQS